KMPPVVIARGGLRVSNATSFARCWRTASIILLPRATRPHPGPPPQAGEGEVRCARDATPLLLPPLAGEGWDGGASKRRTSLAVDLGVQPAAHSIQPDEPLGFRD